MWKTTNYSYDPKFHQAVGEQPGEKIDGVLHIGYPQSIPAIQPRKTAEELLTIIDYKLPQSEQ